MVTLRSPSLNRALPSLGALAECPSRKHRWNMTSHKQEPLLSYLQVTCASGRETPTLHKVLYWAVNFLRKVLWETPLCIPRLQCLAQSLAKEDDHRTAVELHLQTRSRGLALVSKGPGFEYHLCQYTHQEPLDKFLIFVPPVVHSS